MAALDREPDQFEGLELVWSGFRMLNQSRGSNGYGPNPLALSEMLAVLNHWSVDEPDEREEFIGYWQALDGTWIAYHEEKAEQRAAAEKARAEAGR